MRWGTRVVDPGERRITALETQLKQEREESAAQMAAAVAAVEEAQKARSATAGLRLTSRIM